MNDIRLALCMNDDQGNSTDKVRRIEAYDVKEPLESLYELEPNFIDDFLNGVCVCRIFSGAKQLKLGRYCYPIKAYREWVGNVCWNEVLITPETHEKIFDALKSMKWIPRDNRPHILKWGMESGTDEWIKRWEK